MATTDSTNANNSDDYTEEDQRLMDQMANFGPSISDQMVEQLERNAAAPERGQQRRVALLVLARDADTLSKLSVEEPDAYDELLAMVEAFEEHTKGLSEAATAAHLRLKLADCRQS